jgi:hypothetical protein
MLSIHASDIGCTGSVSTRAFQKLSAGNIGQPPNIGLEEGIVVTVGSDAFVAAGSMKGMTLGSAGGMVAGVFRVGAAVGTGAQLENNVLNAVRTIRVGIKL